MQITGEFFLLVPRLFAAVVIFLVFYGIAVVIRRLVRATMSRISTEGHVDMLVGQLSYVGALIVGVIIALSLVVNVTALVTSLGLAGFALGFAVKDILGNFLSGIIILAQRPFTLGDTISVSGVEGVVQTIRVRDTVIKTAAEELVYVPNSTIFSSAITNRSVYKQRPVTVSISVAPGADLATALATIGQALMSLEGALPKPEPEAAVTAISDKAARLEAKFWVDTAVTLPARARSTALAALKQALERAQVALGAED